MDVMGSDTPLLVIEVSFPDTSSELSAAYFRSARSAFNSFMLNPCGACFWLSK